MALVALIVVVTAGCGGQAGPPSIAVGSTSDPESTLVAHLYAAALRFYGSPAHVRSVPDPVSELDSGTFRVVPGFTGRLLERFEPDAAARSDTQVYRAMVSALPEGVAAGDYTTSAEDKPAIAVTERTADAWGGRDVTAAVRSCAKVMPGALAGSVPTVEGRVVHDAEATRIPGQCNAFRRVAGGADQCGVDDGRDAEHSVRAGGAVR